jgi:hypothetical protein
VLLDPCAAKPADRSNISFQTDSVKTGISKEPNVGKGGTDPVQNLFFGSSLFSVFDTNNGINKYI